MIRPTGNQSHHHFWYICHRAITILWHIPQLLQGTPGFTSFVFVPDNTYQITASNKARVPLLKKEKMIIKAKEWSARLWKGPGFH